MKIFAIVLVAACFTLSIAGAYIGVYYLPQLLTDDSAALMEAVPITDSEVQMPQTQPTQQTTNPTTKPTPTAAPQEETVTIHTYIFILNKAPRETSVYTDIAKLENYYGTESKMGPLKDKSEEYTCITVALYKEASDGQLSILKQLCLSEFGIVYVVEQIEKSTVFFHGNKDASDAHYLALGYRVSSGATRYTPNEFLDLFF